MNPVEINQVRAGQFFVTAGEIKASFTFSCQAYFNFDLILSVELSQMAEFLKLNMEMYMEGKRQVSLLLAVGIILMPVIFSWATLRDGYSTTIRVIAVAWMVLMFVVVAAAPPSDSPVEAKGSDQVPAVKPKDTADVDEKIETTEAKPVAQAEKKAEPEPAKKAECTTDACISDKYIIDATVACKPEIIRLAQYDHEWLDGFMTSWASRYKVNDDKRSVITYFGDALKLQNGFGAWQNMIYMCTYDGEADIVVNVAVEPGRL